MVDAGLVVDNVDGVVHLRVLGWKFMSSSHGKELGHLADLASDWLFTQQCAANIRSQLAC